MFENVSDKIKIVAKTTFILGMIASIVGGIVMIASMGSDTSGLVAGGIFLMLFGPFVFYALSLFIYGFGEIAEKTCDISHSLRSANLDYSDKQKKQAELNAKIRKLDSLLRDGVISKDEYNTAVTRLTNENDHE